MKIVKSVLLVLIAIFLLWSCSIRKRTVMEKIGVPKNVMIYESKSGVGPCEPSIAISSIDSRVMVVGAVLDFVFRSEDAGLSWEASRLTSSMGVYGDPVLISDEEGGFYYFHLSDPEGKGWASESLLDRIVVQSSVDQGASWNDGVGIGFNPPKDQDKQWSVTDASSKVVYTTWTEFDKYGSKKESDRSRILFSKSMDKGATWTEAIQINQLEGDCIDDDQTTEGAVPVVDNEGNIYVAWAYNEKIYFDYSTDGGTTWLDEDIVVADQIGGWFMSVGALGRVNGLPVLTIDRSDGPNKGNLYVCWADQRNGTDNTDIWISRSTDQGKTWSDPKVVSNDKTQSQQFFAWIDCDPSDGRLYVVYYDQRDLEGDWTDVYLSISKDGGISFEDQKISERPFELPKKGVFFGDYNNITAKNGIIRPLWTRYENEKLSIWTALIGMP